MMQSVFFPFLSLKVTFNLYFYFFISLSLSVIPAHHWIIFDDSCACSVASEKFEQKIMKLNAINKFFLVNIAKEKNKRRCLCLHHSNHINKEMLSQCFNDVWWVNTDAFNNSFTWLSFVSSRDEQDNWIFCGKTSLFDCTVWIKKSRINEFAWIELKSNCKSF